MDEDEDEDEDVIFTVGDDNPFLTPVDDRDPGRRFRGRLAAPVTLWTAAADDERFGLTVSSTVVAEGSPPSVLGLLNPLSDLFDALVESRMFNIHVLNRDDRRLADVFAGRLPSPDPFEGFSWQESSWGPLLFGERSSVGCRLAGTERVGYQELVRGTIEEVRVSDDTDPLAYLRGRYRQLVPIRHVNM
jgi:3-hydroxy-9,10-secoandrosta-1,3,5(10)-triene-9,17-dione monooxygenase reductase component